MAATSIKVVAMQRESFFMSQYFERKNKDLYIPGKVQRPPIHLRQPLI